MGPVKHLSALDALFLQLETPETPMHVGSLMLLSTPRRGRDKRSAFERIRDLIAGRLHLAPIFSRRLAEMPLELANPIWIDAEVDLEYHVRRLKLAAPGTQAQLEVAVARLHEGLLDRGRPLWQFTVIEGLEDGQVGFYAKIHHAALDGQGGAAVAQALLDTTPVAPRKPAAGVKHKVRLPPSTARLLGAALRNTVAQYGRIASALPEAIRAAGRAGAVALSAPKAKKSTTLGPRTPLNVAISARRAFVGERIELAEAKEIARHFEVKLNDVVLAICAGALRRQFAGNKAALARAMVGAVPASLRAPGDTKANSVTMMLVPLATNIADPAKRMAAIHVASTRAKMLTGSLKSAIPTDMPSLGVPWLMAAATPLYRKTAEANRIPVVANVIISNVPGPQVPLYMAGFAMTAYYPVSIVTHGLALNITILSYNGSLDFGLVACAKTVPDLRTFARHVRAAHAELLNLARKQ